MEILYGYCHCGCNEKTTIASMTSKVKGHIKGKPLRFIVGHASKMQPIGKKAYAWKGGIRKWSGRVGIHKPNHKRADSEGYVLRYILIAERILGKPLPEKVVIHHFDEIPSNDKTENLVICENDIYHRLLHQRRRAYEACGHANWRKCHICKEYDEIESLYTYPNKNSGAYHKRCKSKYQKERKKKL